MSRPALAEVIRLKQNWVDAQKALHQAIVTPVDAELDFYAWGCKITAACRELEDATSLLHNALTRYTHG